LLPGIAIMLPQMQSFSLISVLLPGIAIIHVQNYVKISLQMIILFKVSASNLKTSDVAISLFIPKVFVDVAFVPNFVLVNDCFSMFILPDISFILLLR
jgi:hypothetical protein